MKELLEKIEETREQLLAEILPLSSDQLNRKLQLGRWSVAQTCRHLVLTELLFTEAIAAGLRSEPSASIERKPIELVLDKSKKLESPDIAKPEESDFSLDELTAMLVQARGKLLQLLLTVKDSSILYERHSRHVFFKDLALYQWVELLALHEQRHIDQIKRLLDDMSE
ncbi:DinB family protein [Paenibacillus kobensis]|uniref:DinB family protein n=1 Tax=Paenibacillus kobensis TaxID=59841 RepID=UPI000FD91FD1|nr:DinB family protein [Paenibacillus kobensis]